LGGIDPDDLEDLESDQPVPLDSMFDSALAQHKRQKRQFERRPKEQDADWFGHDSEDVDHQPSSEPSSPTPSPRTSFDEQRRNSGDDFGKEFEVKDEEQFHSAGPSGTFDEISPNRRRRLRSFSSGPRDTTTISEVFLERVMEGIIDEGESSDSTSLSPEASTAAEPSEGTEGKPNLLKRSISVPVDVIQHDSSRLDEIDEHGEEFLDESEDKIPKRKVSFEVNVPAHAASASSTPTLDPCTYITFESDL